MKNYYWYSIEIENENCLEFEQYLNTIANNLKDTPYVFKAYYAAQTNGLTINYFIYKEVQYLYSFIKNRYKQILISHEPENSKIVQVNFY